jgi:hypothetical protein
MTIELKVYDNGDHTCLVWLPSDEKPIPDCRGFTVHRTLKACAGANAVESYLHGFVGFSDADKLYPTAPWKFPVQRFMWSDYGVAPGNEVQYFDCPSLRTRQKSPDAFAGFCQRANAAHDHYRPGVRTRIGLFQQRHRVGAMGVARACNRRPKSEAERSDQAIGQSAARCAERSASPAIAALDGVLKGNCEPVSAKPRTGLGQARGIFRRLDLRG